MLKISALSDAPETVSSTFFSRLHAKSTTIFAKKKEEVWRQTMARVPSQWVTRSNSTKGVNLSIKVRKSELHPDVMWLIKDSQWGISFLWNR